MWLIFYLSTEFHIPEQHTVLKYQVVFFGCITFLKIYERWKILHHFVHIHKPKREFLAHIAVYNGHRQGYGILSKLGSYYKLTCIEIID